MKHGVIMKHYETLRYSKALRTWIWISLGLVVLDVLRKVSVFVDPCFQKILVLDFGWVLTFGSDLANMQCEKGLGRRGSRFLGHELVGSGLGWPGGRRQS